MSGGPAGMSGGRGDAYIKEHSKGRNQGTERTESSGDAVR